VSRGDYELLEAKVPAATGKLLTGRLQPVERARLATSCASQSIIVALRAAQYLVVHSFTKSSYSTVGLRSKFEIVRSQIS